MAVSVAKVLATVCDAVTDGADVADLPHGPMPAMSGISDQQLADVVAHLRALQR